MNRRARRRQARTMPATLRAITRHLRCPDCNSDLTEPWFDVIWHVGIAHDETCPYYRMVTRL